VIFVLNPEKNFTQTRLVVVEKNVKTMHFDFEKTTSMSRRLCYSNNELKASFRL